MCAGTQTHTATHREAETNTETDAETHTTQTRQNHQNTCACGITKHGTYTKSSSELTAEVWQLAT